MKLQWTKTQMAWIADCRGLTVKRDQIVESQVNHSIRKFCEYLLGFGGTRVCVRFDEESFCDFLFEQGKVISFKRIRLKKGMDCRCHINSAHLWKSSQGRYQIVTGYGLSDDDMWRRHTWVMCNADEIIETTVRRKKYFGVFLDKEQAEWFCQTYGGVEK